jgi:hypothetical protein
MADFNALSNELRILIIEHVNDASTMTESEDENPIDGNYGLPKVNSGLLHLSRVNHNLRSLVVPYLFRTVILRNSVESGDSVGLIATSDRAKYVGRLRFVGTSVVPIYDPKYSGRRELRDVELPANVRHILSKLDCFPALEGVDVWFALRQDSESGLREYEGGHFEFYIENDFWDRDFLLDDVFLDLGKNKSNVVKELKIHNFIPDLNMFIVLDDMHPLLDELSSFSMQLCADWGFIEDYPQATEEAIRDLWDPLRNITHLSIASGPQELLGLDIMDSDANLMLDLGYARLPNLTSIAFDYIWVDNDLMNTLVAHADTLHSVRLDHAFMARFSRSSVGNYIHKTWDSFFLELNHPSHSFPSLTEFEVLCSGDWIETGVITGKQQRAKDRERQRLLEEGTPELRYCLVNDSGGYCTDFDIKEYEDPDIVIDPGEDRLSYNRFMERVKSNRERLGIA